MSINDSFRRLPVFIAITAALSMNAMAQAQERTCMIDWKALSLTPQQSQSIQQLDSQWKQDYQLLKPLIQEEQRKLQRLLETHNSDSLEVMALQGSIAKNKEKLAAAATANYLKKRQILNEHQQHQLEQMMRQKRQERQKELHPGATTEVVPDRIQDIMQKVKHIWPSGGN